MSDSPGLGIETIIGDKREQILQLASRYGATNVRVFGSVARGDAQPDSDLDLLVNFHESIALRDMIRLTNGLQALLGRRVEVVNEADLREELRPYILREAISISVLEVESAEY